MATQNFSHGRANRLNTTAEFSRVFSKAQRSRDRYFTILWRSNDVARARIGFAVAKKNIPLATGRNRVRRAARESFRQQQSLGGVDIVVMAQSVATQVNNSILFASLAKHWDRIRQSGDQEKTQ